MEEKMEVNKDSLEEKLSKPNEKINGLLNSIDV